MSEIGFTSRPGCLILSFNRQPPASPSAMRMIIAQGFFTRLRGLLGTNASWGSGNTVLVIPQCAGVHTFGMRYALDIAFIDMHGVVLRAERKVTPGHLLSCKGAVFVLERPHINASSWLSIGERLQICSTIHEKVRCDDRKASV